jgi:lysophospholipase L1-like esterase
MTSTSPRTSQRRAVAVGVAAAAIALGMVGPAFAGSAPHARAAVHTKKVAQKPVVAGSRYLALGDSVPFGYREADSIPKPNVAKPNTMVGFPEDIAANLGLKLTNAACPGETTASFLNAKAQSNGCENDYVKGNTKPSHTPGADYRVDAPLHVKYASKTESQMTYAEKYLKKYPNTRLVTLMIGANDGFICQVQYTDGCVGEVAALTANITKNATKIFKGLRNTAHYTGQLDLVTYYSFDYTDPTLTLEVGLLNGALEKAAKPFHVTIANGFAAFKTAAATHKGDTCAAGLLTVLNKTAATPCGVHTSPAGAAVLGQAVEQAIKK